MTTPRDLYLNHVRAIIANEGWAVQGVLPDAADPADAQTPALHYTVGLTRRGLPELATVGLATDLAHVLLNVLAAAMGPELAGGGMAEVSLPTGPVRVLLAPAPGGAVLLRTAVALYGDRVRALQAAFAF